MKTLIKTMLFAAPFMVTVPAQADICGLGPDLRHIEHRIERGIDDGSLSRREAGKLKYEHNKIWRLARSLREDGRLSYNECVTLEKQVDYLADKVTEMKHDRKTSWYPGRSTYHDRSTHHDRSTYTDRYGVKRFNPANGSDYYNRHGDSRHPGR